MIKYIITKYLRYAVSFLIGCALSWPLIDFVNDDRLLRNAMNFAQIVGVFAGLGLTAISIMAALPLDGWVAKVGKTNAERRTELIDMIKKTPEWFQDNLVIQIFSLSVMIMLSVFVNYSEEDRDFGFCRITANCLVGGALVVSAHSMVVLFKMMKSLLSLSIKRFE